MMSQATFHRAVRLTRIQLRLARGEPRAATTMKTICLFCALLILSGCASAKYAAYDNHNSSTGTLLKNEAGLELFVDPVLEADRQAAFFGYNLVRSGVLPVFVRVTNITSDQSFLLKKSGMTLNFAGAREGFTSVNDNVTRDSGAGAVSVLGAVALSTPLMVAGPLMEASDQQKSQNLVDKQYYDNTVSPSAHAEGFVYFQLPKGSHDLSSFSIKFVAEAIKSGKQIQISYEHK